MATPGVTLSASLAFNAVLTGTHALTPGSAGVSISKSLQFLPGTATLDQTDSMFADQRTLAASASENLDLTGTLLSPLGSTVTQAEVVALYFEVISGSIIVGNAASNPFVGPLGATGTYTLAAGEFVLMSSRAGYVVTPSTGDLLKITAGSGGAVYDIVIAGRSVAR